MYTMASYGVYLAMKLWAFLLMKYLPHKLSWLLEYLLASPFLHQKHVSTFW